MWFAILGGMVNGMGANSMTRTQLTTSCDIRAAIRRWFSRRAWAVLSHAEMEALVLDIWGMIDDEGLAPDSAVRTLRRRIGGSEPLKRYVDCLMVGRAR